MLEDFETAIVEDGVRRRRLCGFSKWVTTLSEADQAKANEIVFNENYDCRALARYFNSKGATFNDQVIYRHRHLRCCGQGQ
jgi:hypothetical protein